MEGMQMSAAEPIEVRDMAIIHRTFRSAFAESARLVRAAPTPSPDRVTFLADHIDFATAMLHHHHQSEDELLFPRLIERAPDQAGKTEEVAREHELVAGAVESVSAACANWREQPCTETGEALARSLDELNVVLTRHLDDEEQNVVPLAAVTLTQQEWDELGAHARAGIPRNKLPVAFGLILEPLTDADRAYMKSQLPAPVRLLYPILIQRPWTKYATTLRSGT
jgi:hemerythrin-like domain-containing protein